MKRYKLQNLGSHAIRFTAAMLAIQLSLSAQTSHSVTASGTSFTPNDLTIQVGDTVIWTNTSGTHNVNGTTETYPDNPASFGNEIGADWEYEFVFTTAGVYDYQCDVHVGFGMVGKVTVQDSTSTTVPYQSLPERFSLFPNPADDHIVIALESGLPAPGAADVLDMTGKILLSRTIPDSEKRIVLDVGSLHEGKYLLRLRSGQKVLVHAFLKY